MTGSQISTEVKVEKQKERHERAAMGSEDGRTLSRDGIDMNLGVQLHFNEKRSTNEEKTGTTQYSGARFQQQQRRQDS